MQRIEDVESPVVGRYYLVPCVMIGKYILGMEAGAAFPVLGDLHEDRDVIGFQDDHWHPDFRFVSNGWIRGRMASWRRDFVPRASRRESAGMLIFGAVVSFKNTVPFPNGEQIQWVKRKMHRPHPTFPSEIFWMSKLEDAYEKAKARCGVCPHRGISLEGAPVRNGARVCPGHGLSWSIKDGSLVRRSNS